MVTCQSHGIVASISSRYPNVKTYRFSNGVNTLIFNKNAKSKILDRWKNNKKFSIVYAGLHGIAQGLDQVLSSAKIIQSKGYDIQFIFIGDGPEKSKLIDMKEKLKLENVTFVPIQHSNVMPEVWASADIGIISLKKYILGAVPSKLYEVMSSETPIIFIGEGEAREIVEKSECGLTVSPDDIDGVANSIINMIKSVNLRKFYGKNGRKKFWKIIIEKIF